MKKFIVNLWQYLKEIQTLFAVLTTFGISMAIFKFDILWKQITITYWQLLLFIVAPYFLYYGFWLRYKMKKRRFKTGDLVTPLNEKHSVYVVYYYRFFNPTKVVCKMRNHNLELVVDDKFLMPYNSNENDSIFRSIAHINNPVIDAKITKL